MCKKMWIAYETFGWDGRDIEPLNRDLYLIRGKSRLVPIVTVSSWMIEYHHSTALPERYRF